MRKLNDADVVTNERSEKMERKVWSEFQYTKKDGTILKFSVVDCPKDRIGDVRNIYQEYFMRDESIQKLAGIAKSKEAKAECLVLLTEMMKEEGMHVAICIENNTDSLVGVSCMKLTLNTKDLMPDIMPQTKEVAKLFEILDGMVKMYDVPRYFAVDKYYDGRGIIVHPDYRGFGIGSVLVESRKNICKEHGVPLTTAWMTSIGTQKAAERDGWDAPYEIDSHEFSRKFDVTPFDGIAPTFKVMVKKVK